MGVLMCFLISCCAERKAAEDVVMVNSTEIVNESLNDFKTDGFGIVKNSKDACIYIDASIKIEGVVKNKTLYPVNLDEKFQKNGSKINFDFTLSRAMQPSGCDVDYVVSVSNVSTK